MELNYKFDFSVNRENHTVKVTREFKAPLTRVWAAWTEPETLDHWWAPKPWKSKTRSMEFEEGGKRIYAMIGPEGEEHWSFAEYISITPERNFKFHDGFCDKKENTIDELPQSAWSVDFNGHNGSTTVTVTIKHNSLSDLETILKMGFREGFTASLENLDEVLSK